MRRDKSLAAFLAIIGGFMGLHRFYLGNVGTGLINLIFFWLLIVTVPLGIIEGIVILSMSEEEFDNRYNYGLMGYDRRAGREDRQDRNNRRQRNDAPRRRQERPAPPQTQPTTNAFKISGIAKFKEYDFKGAIEDFEKAVEADPSDYASFFNLACAYSMTEKAQPAFDSLQKAVELGFVQFDKINNHDSLAWLRTQSEFNNFVKNNYKMPLKLEAPEENLLDRITRLGELRDKGFLTDEEFIREKRKLLDSI